MNKTISYVPNETELTSLFSTYSEELKNKLMRIYNIVLEDLKDKKRLSGKPFILHPLNVAYMLYKMGSDPNSVIVALIHHCSEDALKKLNEEKLIDDEITDMLNKLKLFSNLKQRSKKYHFDQSVLRTLLFTGVRDFRVLIIKLADKVNNLSELKALPPEEQIRIAKESLVIYAPMAHKLGINELKTQIEDLTLEIIYPNIYKKLKSEIEERLRDADKNLKFIQSLLNELFKDTSFKIYGRVKHLYSIMRKLNSGKKIDQIYDLIALRIITNSVAECYEVLEVLKSRFEVVENRIKDYIANPKSNGYQSIHITLKYQGIVFEVQIRTWEMHYFAEYGVAAHWKYKNIESDKLDKFLEWGRQIMEFMQKNPDSDIKLNLFKEQIFVFTPKGDPVQLPLGATALDFAFKIHTDIGYRAKYAKINDVKQSIFTVLQPGDVVEIITGTHYEVSEKWLPHVKTTYAKSCIRTYLGLKSKGYNIGNKIDPSTLINFKDKFEIAGCCKDINYGESLVAIKTKEGYRIHKSNCNNIQHIAKKIPVSWKKIYTLISIHGFDEETILLRILESIKARVKLHRVDASASRNKFHIVLIVDRVDKKRSDALKKIIKNVSKSVQSIEFFEVPYC